MPSSSARRALEGLGVRLEELRVEARLTGRELARRCAWPESKVSKIEHGRQAPTDEDIRAWCQRCGADGRAADLIALLRNVEGLFVEWPRLERAGLRMAQESVVPRWERTRRFRIYSSWMVPGPLQTARYIHAALTAIRLRRDLPNDLDAAAQVRVAKQRVLDQAGRQFAIVLEESVLHQVIGGRETMLGQLGHLLTVGTRPSVSLGIVPLGSDRSAIWPTEGFWMFDDAEVTIELISGHLTVTQPSEIRMYGRTFVELAKQAVYGERARALISSAIDRLGEASP